MKKSFGAFEEIWMGINESGIWSYKTKALVDNPRINEYLGTKLSWDPLHCFDEPFENKHSCIKEYKIRKGKREMKSSLAKPCF